MLTLSATSTSIVASWDTQQRLTYNPNAPRNPNKKPKSLSVSPTSQSTGNATLTATNIRTNQIVSDLLKRRSPGSNEGKFMHRFLISLVVFRFSVGKLEVSSVWLMGVFEFVSQVGFRCEIVIELVVCPVAELFGGVVEKWM